MGAALATDPSRLTVVDACLVLGLTPTTVYRYIRTGQLRRPSGPHVRPVTFAVADVLAVKQHLARLGERRGRPTNASRLAAKLEVLA
jgi:hypothetical protein